MKILFQPKLRQISESMLDIIKPEHDVELNIDWINNTLWVNIGGACAFRVSHAPYIFYNGEKPMSNLQAGEVRTYLISKGAPIEEVDIYIAMKEDASGRQEHCWRYLFSSLTDIYVDFINYPKD